jgi:hypothetical protein
MSILVAAKLTAEQIREAFFQAVPTLEDILRGKDETLGRCVGMLPDRHAQDPVSSVGMVLSGATNAVLVGDFEGKDFEVMMSYIPVSRAVPTLLPFSRGVLDHRVAVETLGWTWTLVDRVHDWSRNSREMLAYISARQDAAQRPMAPEYFQTLLSSKSRKVRELATESLSRMEEIR